MLMGNSTKKKSEGSQSSKDWALWEVAFKTRNAAELFGQALIDAGYKTSITGDFDSQRWIIRTAAPLDKMHSLKAVQP